MVIQPFNKLLGKLASSTIQAERPFWPIETETNSSLLSVPELIQVFLFLITVAEAAVIHTYIQLCHEDYRWWWNAFFVGAAPAAFLLALSVIQLAFSAHSFGSFLALFVSTFVLASVLALIGGSLGFFAAFRYNTHIYSHIKQN